MSLDLQRNSVVKIATYADLSAYLLVVGDSYRDLQIIDSIDLLGEVVSIPSNVNISRIRNGSIISNGTLCVETMTADPLHQWINVDLTVRGLRRVRPEWCGAVGDGIHDDTIGIQRALNLLTDRSDNSPSRNDLTDVTHPITTGTIHVAVPPVVAVDSNASGAWGTYGGEYIFRAKQYRITQTIFSEGLQGVHFTGTMGSRSGEYTAVNSNGWDSHIFWDPAVPVTMEEAMADPASSTMFYINSAQRIKFTGIRFSGARGSPVGWVSPTPVEGQPAWDNSFTHAYHAVWIDNGHAQIFFEACVFSLVGIGLRICSQFDHNAAVWSADNQTYVAPYGAWHSGRRLYDGIEDDGSGVYGGHQSDNYSLLNCSWGLCTIAGVSIESSQALDMYFQKPYFVSCNTDFKITACSGIVIETPTFLNTTHHGVKIDQRASGGGFIMTNMHEESTGGVFFDGWGLNGGPGYYITGGGMNACRLRGGTTGMTLTYNNGSIGVLEVLTSNVSLDIKNSSIARFCKVNSAITGFLKFRNVTVQHLSSNWAGFKNVDISECQMGQGTELSKIPFAVRTIDDDSRYLAPDILLGDMYGYYPVLKLNKQYVFTVTSANAAIGDTYSNNGKVFTVVATIAEMTALIATGTGLPEASGTLTRTAGTGDATITYSAYTPPVLNGNVVDINNILFKAGTTTDTSTLAVGTVPSRYATFKADGTAKEAADALAYCIEWINPSSSELNDGTWPSTVNWNGIEVDPTIRITPVVSLVDDSIQLQSGITIQVTPQTPNQSNIVVESTLSSTQRDWYPVIELRGVILLDPNPMTVTINGVVFTSAAVTNTGAKEFAAPVTTPNDYVTAEELRKCINAAMNALADSAKVFAVNYGRGVQLRGSTPIRFSTSNTYEIYKVITDPVGMGGTAIWGKGAKYIACTGCYQDNYGRLIATAVIGMMYVQSPAGISVRRFEGAVFGELLESPLDASPTYTSAKLLTVFDTTADNFIVGQVGKGITLTSPDGTKTKTIQLNDAGTGLNFI